MKRQLSAALAVAMILAVGDSVTAADPPPRRRAVRALTPAAPCPASTKAGWKMVFCDEFDDSAFSEKNYWNPTGTWDWPGGTHGDELQYYTRFNKDFPTACDKGGINTVQSNGTLKIVTKQEPGSYETWHWDAAHVTPDNPNGFHTKCEAFNYTSSMIATPGKFLYGYFETRAKIPDGGHVLWPAFWLWEGGGSEYREIDIFEFGACQPESNFAGFNMHISRELDNAHVQDANDSLNHYPGHFIVPGDLADFHTYAVRWSPNSVVWYVDDHEVYKVVQHTPHRDMHLIANMAIASWCHPAGNNLGLIANAFPYEFELDYIRVYQSTEDELLWQWGNGGTDRIGGWYVNPGDQFISGDFDANGRDELLAVGANGWSKVVRFGGGEWLDAWHNNGGGTIAGWYLNPGDRFIAGDFDGDGRDEVLAVATNGWSKLLEFDGTKWNDVWHNGGSDLIAGWYLNPGDQFAPGDFDGDGRDELLAVALSGWSKLLAFDGTQWNDLWHNGGSDLIAGWYLNPGDQFVPGDFDADGRRELLAIARNGWSKVLAFDGAQWQDRWHNGGSGLIAGWYLNAGDQFIGGDFDGTAGQDVLAISQGGWSKLLRFDNLGWHDVWHNDGGGTLHLWYMNPTDGYLGLDVEGDGKQNVLAISANGWAHLLQRSSILQF